MQVHVQPHDAIKPLLRRWRRNLSADRVRRQELGTLYWEELVRRIVAARGRPADVVEDVMTRPPTFWCELGGGAWVRLLVRPDRRLGFFGPVVREVLIIDLRPHPPAVTPP